MKIAQVSPLFESVPPQLYGGTERVVSYLTEELVRQGHEVTLFASGDSVTQAELVPVVDRSLRLHPDQPDAWVWHTIMMDSVFARADDFDVIHFHTDYLHLPLARLIPTHTVTTLHGRLDLPDLPALYQHFSEAPLVSISRSQREPLPRANWCANISHGLPPNLYRFHAKPSDYFAFLGRISPEERVDRAIEIAIACDRPLKIAAKVSKTDEVYFKEIIQPMLTHPLIEYIGEIGEHEKNEFLGQAAGLLFPIDWPEPFGLVMIESMACGTPVLAYNWGSVSEVMAPGITGFVVDNQADAIAAAPRLLELDRAKCREVFDQRFTVTHMAQNYLDAYRRIARPSNLIRLNVAARPNTAARSPTATVTPSAT